MRKKVLDLSIKRALPDVLRMCACMGPQHGEPFCPCEMDRRGLPPSIERVREEAKFAHFVKSGGLDKAMRRVERKDEPQ